MNKRRAVHHQTITEAAILTVYRYAYPFHYHFIQKHKQRLWMRRGRRWKTSTMLLWGMRVNG